jgi:hypothetical protein
MTYGPGPTPNQPPSGDPFGGKSFGDPFGGAGSPGGPPTYSAPPPSAPPKTNILATLSVVFAFAFAPAGAMLGHLGLSQIKRTGQPGRSRALVGMALSYSIIVIIVAALVVTAVLGRHASAPSASSGSSPESSPGRTVSAEELAGLLLTVDEVKAIMAQQPGASPAPNLTAQQPSTEPVPFPYPEQGTVSPDSCISSMIAGSDNAYNNSGYRAIHTVTMSQPGPDNTDQSVTQSVAVFGDAASAQRALDVYLGQQDECRDHGDLATIHFAPPGVAQQQNWTMGKPVKYRDYYMTIINLDVENFWLVSERDRYMEKRTLAVRYNVLVDVVVRGVGVTSQQQFVTNAILDRLK